MTPRRGIAIGLAACMSAVVAAGCSDGPSLPRLSDLNPFAEKEAPLPGKRIPVALAESKVGVETGSVDHTVSLPAARANEAWSQPGGGPGNAPGHLALGAAIRTAWSADAGTGSSSYGRLTASPIVVDGKVFTLDTEGRVSAFSASGSQAWRVSITPQGEKAHKGFGGGLAADGGRVFAATGYGWVVALESASGKKVWEKNLGAPVRASPTAAGGKLIAVTSDGVRSRSLRHRRPGTVGPSRPARAGEHPVQRQSGDRRRHCGRTLSFGRGHRAARLGRAAGLD